MILNRRFFLGLGILMILFVAGFIDPGIYIGAIALFVFWISVLFMDVFSVFHTKAPFSVERKVNQQLSLGDENPVTLKLLNQSRITFYCSIYDETPYQLQMRDFVLRATIPPNKEVSLDYKIRPTERGAYEFGNTNVYIRTRLGLVARKVIIKNAETTKVYPSIIQMKKLELQLFHKTMDVGIKKIRRLGHNNEFEQIKNYVQGDDIRKVNWKATSRRREIMINQYQDERSQSVYAIIDKSRVMRDPFEGLSLLDHAINSALIFSNTALKKGDKVGLVTFSNKIGDRIHAERKSVQLKMILNTLYNQKTHFKEANYDLLYQEVRRHIKGRSLLMLYTNFDNESALKRAMPILKIISRIHLLVVVFFENTAILDEIEKPTVDLKSIYDKTIAEKYALEKNKMKIELQKNGIQCVLTHPDRLNFDAINKYLEIKSKGML